MAGTWYNPPPQACKFLKLKHHHHLQILHLKKVSYIERKNSHNILRTGLKVLMMIIIFLGTKKKKKRCKLYHVINWLSMFADIHNKLIQNEMMMFLS